MEHQRDTSERSQRKLKPCFYHVIPRCIVFFLLQGMSLSLSIGAEFTFRFLVFISIFTLFYAIDK